MTQCSPSAPPVLPQNTAPPEHGFHQNTASIRTLLPSEHGYHCFNFTILRSVDPKQPSNFHFDLSLKLSQGEVHDFSGEVQKFSGGCKTSQGRCAPPHTSPQNPALPEHYFHQNIASTRTLLSPEHCFHQNTTSYPGSFHYAPRWRKDPGPGWSRVSQILGDNKIFT